MRINFNKIEIHNFMSFADEVFDYSKYKGMNLVCGKNNDLPGAKNGTGKSTLFSALVFCLFGETQNKLKNENIHNRYIESKEVRVVVDFSIENDKFTVSSGFNKYGAAYCNIVKHEGKNDLDLTKSSIIETRKYLEKEILRCDMSIFLRTIMLSSDQTYNFFRLRKGEKKEFIEKLFDISIFGDMYNVIHRDILNFDKEILSQQNRLMMLNKSNSEYVECIEKYNKDHNAKISEYAQKLEDLKKKYDVLKNTVVASNTEEASKYETFINKINEAILKVNKAISLTNKNKNSIDVSLHKLTTSKKSHQKLIDTHSELLSKLCDDCKTTYKQYYSIDKCVDEIKDIDIKYEALSKQYDAELIKEKDYNSKLVALNNKLQVANKKLDALTSEYVKTNTELTKLESRIDSVKNELNNEKNAVNPYIKLFESNKKQIEDETNQLKETSDQYKYLKFAETIVSQDTLRKFIIKDLIGLLNNKIKTYLTKLGAKYTVIFDSDMDYEFITDGGSCEYDNFSAGERQRIMIATCFAFRDFMAIRNNLSSNILILDEFIDGNVDSMAIDGVISILRDFILLYNQNIYIVSHRKEIDNSIFNNILQIVKTNHISKVTVLDV